MRTQPSYDADQFSLGIEGFYDVYEEPSGSLTLQGASGGANASYTHYFDPRWFAALEARGSYGQMDYESVSGSVDNLPQWEAESRLLVGADRTMNGGSIMRGYVGLGAHYISVNGKDTITNLGLLGYDRRIMQFYIPLGATYKFNAYGLQFAPNLEVDPMVWGNVSTRLGNIPGYYNVENRQTSGIGLRGEFMMGQDAAGGAGWQFGPFFRYWNIPDSDVTIDPNGDAWIEPKNKRLQAGATLKLLF